MGRRRLLSLLGCLFLGFVFLLSACHQGNTIANLPELLAKKQADVTSYQLTVLLEQTDGQQLAISQWYKAPDRLRTDVLQADELAYQFFLCGDDLLVRHVPTGREEQLRLSSENALFTTALLHELWREAQTASWQKLEERPTSYFGEFSWRDQSGVPKLGALWLNTRTLLPEEVTLFFGATKELHLRFESITLNPALGEPIFQP